MLIYTISDIMGLIALAIVMLIGVGIDGIKALGKTIRKWSKRNG